MKRIALLLALLLCLCGCAQQDQESTVTPDQLGEAQQEEEPQEEATEVQMTTAQEETAEPAAAPVVEIQENTDSASADDGTVVLNTNYPSFTVTGAAGEAIAAELEQTVADYKAQTAHGVSGESESLVADALDYYQQSQEDGFPWDVPYTDELTATVLRCDEKVLCVSFTSYTHFGGVHGFAYSFGRCYDAQTGQRLTLERLAADGVNLQEYALAAVLEMSRNPELYEDGMFFDGYEEDLPGIINDDFVLNDKGLTFSAAPYALAAYAYGPIDFTLTYDQLTEVMQARYLP